MNNKKRRDKDTQGRRPYEDRSTDWRNMSIRQRPPRTNFHYQEEAGNDLRGRKVLLAPWFWISSIHYCENIHFCCFKPSSLWCFVTAVLRNEYSLRKLINFWYCQVHYCYNKYLKNVEVALDKKRVKKLSVIISNTYIVMNRMSLDVWTLLKCFVKKVFLPRSWMTMRNMVLNTGRKVIPVIK